MTVRGHIIGTPSYMSPEQATGRQIDHRSDIFSAGGVFYWMPLRPQTLRGPRSPVRPSQGQLRIPRLPRGEAPAPLVRIVFRALAKDPARRYQRISDMFGDLQRFKAQFEADALRLGAWRRARAGHPLAPRRDGRPPERLGAGVQERRTRLPRCWRATRFSRARPGFAGALTFRHAVTESITRDLESTRALAEADALALRRTVEAAQAEASAGPARQ